MKNHKFRTAYFANGDDSFVGFGYWDAGQQRKKPKTHIPCYFNSDDQYIGLSATNGDLIYCGDIILSNYSLSHQAGRPGDKFVIVGGVRGYCFDAVPLEDYLAGKRYAPSGGKGASAYHIISSHGECKIVGHIYQGGES